MMLRTVRSASGQRCGCTARSSFIGFLSEVSANEGVSSFDIAGYSALMGGDEARTVQDL